MRIYMKFVQANKIRIKKQTQNRILQPQVYRANKIESSSAKVANYCCDVRVSPLMKIFNIPHRAENYKIL